MILMAAHSNTEPFNSSEFPFPASFPGTFETKMGALMLSLEVTGALNLPSEKNYDLLCKVSRKIKKLMMIDERFLKLINEYSKLRFNFPSSKLEANKTYMALLRKLYSKLDDQVKARHILGKLNETLAILRLTHELGRD